LVSFADDVVKRFKNPYIEHQLMSIALNSVSKFAVRVVPSILGYIKHQKELPKILTISFAALIKFYEKHDEENVGELKELREELSKIEGFENHLVNYLEAIETDTRAFLKEVLCEG
ncbi:MAG: tagaturonate reductase, partial [Defluviitaleaceae bacterium]|nr:tagaturonate reductase [Defluviitaleaceae bacterium]